MQSSNLIYSHKNLISKTYPFLLHSWFKTGIHAIVKTTIPSNISLFSFKDIDLSFHTFLNVPGNLAPCSLWDSLHPLLFHPLPCLLVSKALHFFKVLMYTDTQTNMFHPPGAPHFLTLLHICFQLSFYTLSNSVARLCSFSGICFQSHICKLHLILFLHYASPTCCISTFAQRPTTLSVDIVYCTNDYFCPTCIAYFNGCRKV